MVQSELKGWIVAVIGGDLRMLEHMRQARLSGAVVQHYGGVPGADEAAGRPGSPTLADAVFGNGFATRREPCRHADAPYGIS